MVQLVHERQNNQEDYLDAEKRHRVHDLDATMVFSIKVILLVVVSLLDQLHYKPIKFCKMRVYTS